MHFEQMHTVFIICTGTNANKPMVYQSCLFPLEYNEPSKCQVYKLRDRTHAGNTASCMTIAGQLVEGVGDVFFCKKLSKKLYCIILPYIHYLLHSRPTNFRAKEAWKKNNTIFCQLPSSQMLPRFEKLQSSTVPFLERKPTNRPISSSSCPWSQNPPLHMRLTLFWLNGFGDLFLKGMILYGLYGCFVRCCRFPFCSWFVFAGSQDPKFTMTLKKFIAQLCKLPLRGLPWAYVLISRSMDVPKRSRVWIHCGRIHTPGNFDMEPKVGEYPGKTHSRIGGLSQGHSPKMELLTWVKHQKTS